MENIKIRLVAIPFAAMMILLFFSLIFTVSADSVPIKADESTLGKAIENDSDDYYSYPQFVKASVSGDSITLEANEEGAGSGVVCIVYEGGQAVISYTVTVSGTDGSETYTVKTDSIVKWSKKPCAVINYEKETIYLIGMNADEVNGSVYYALKAKTDKEDKNKYYPIYMKSKPDPVVEIDISKYIPKKKGKEYTIAMKFADFPTDVAYVTISGRPAAPVKGSVELKDDALSSGSVSGIEVKFGLGEYIPVYTEAKEDDGETAASPAKNEIKMSAEAFPSGGSGTARFAATTSEFASATIKVSIKAMTKAPKLTVETKGFKIGPLNSKGKATSVDMDYIKGIKSATSHQVLLPHYYVVSDDGETALREYSDKSESSSWISVPYDETGKATFVRDIKKAVKDASYFVEADNYEVNFSVVSYPLSTDGKSYMIPFRTAATAKSPASSILYLAIPVDMFKASAVTAALEAKDISVTSNSQFSTTLKVTLKDGTFKGEQDVNAESFILTPGASGLRIGSVALSENNTVATLTLAGEAKTTDKTDIEVKISKDALLDEDGQAVSTDVTAKNEGKATVEVKAAAE